MKTLSKFFFSFLLIISIVYLARGFYQLIEPEQLPVDLGLRFGIWKSIFKEKIDIYSNVTYPEYPPSFYFYLIPFFSYSYFYIDKIWVALNSIALITLIAFVSDVVKPERNIYHNSFLISIISIHSISQALGVGQVSILITSSLIVGIVLALRDEKTLLNQLFAILLLSFSMTKYSLTLPIIITLFAIDRLRQSIGYSILINIILSLLVLEFIDSSIFNVISNTLNTSESFNSLGSLDLQTLSSLLYLPKSTFLGMVVFFLILSYLIGNSSKLVIWDKLALSSLISRLFIYHAHYDNVILVFLLIALWKRIPQFETLSKELMLYGLVVVSLIIPARFLEWHAPYYGIFLIYQLVIWLYAGFYLIQTSSHSKHALS